MANGNGNMLRVWMGIITALLVPLVAGAVAFGVVSANVERNEREVTAVEQRSITRAAENAARLVRIEDKLDRLLIRSQ